MRLSSVNPIPLSTLLAKQHQLVNAEKPSKDYLFVRAGVFEVNKGSAYVELGSAKLVCVVDGPVEPEKSTGIDDYEGKIKVEVKGAPELNLVVESAVCSFVRLDRFPKAQINIQITILEDDAAKLAAALLASSVALCNAEIETYDLCLASHFWVSTEGDIINDDTACDSDSNCASLTVALLPSLNQMVCCEHQGYLQPSVLLKVIPKAVEATVTHYPVVRRAIEAFSIPNAKNSSKQ